MTENLSNVCSDILSLAVKLKRTRGDYGNADELLEKIKELFASFEIGARGIKNITSDDIFGTKYALAALLDEIILNSEWTEKDKWSSKSLQLDFFEENIAGTEFFNKLENLRSRISGKLAILEIYYFCLVLGFEGKYKIEGLEKLKFFTENLAADIKNAKKDTSVPLSPGWEPPAELIKKMKREMPPWVIGVSCFFISFVFYIIYQILLVMDSSKVIHVIEGIISKTG